MRAPLTLALGLAVGLAACTDAGSAAETGEPGMSGSGIDESEALRLGRVHLVLSALHDEPSGDVQDVVAGPDGFEVTARFALVRGLDEEFVRARADMPDLLEDLLSPGQCASEAALWPADPPADFETETLDSSRELVLVDAGDLEVQVGDTRVDVPLSLVPDLLPYMSGVEYAYFDEQMLALDDADAITIAAAGGLSEDLPAFSVESPMPLPVEVTSTGNTDEHFPSIARGALLVRWANGGSDATIGLTLTPLLGGEPVGDDIVCNVADRGEARLDLAELRTLGFATDADSVRVEASRTRTSLFDAGAWAGTELVVERRDAAQLPLR